jgi:hypothetical protein
MLCWVAGNGMGGAHCEIVRTFAIWLLNDWLLDNSCVFSIYMKGIYKHYKSAFLINSESKFEYL